MTTGQTYKESDGKGVQVTLQYTVVANQLAVVNNWIGVTVEAGDSGDIIALEIEQCERQLVLPAGVSPDVGDILYLDIDDLTGHTPDDTAYGTSAGAGNVAVMKITKAKPSGSNVVCGIMLNQFAS